MTSADNIIQKIESIIKFNREDDCESNIVISVDWINESIELGYSVYLEEE